VVAGIILAAGRSLRMGAPKALLRTPDGRTFVRRLMLTLRQGGIAPVVVVGRPDDGALRAEVEQEAGRYIVNADADAGGQLSSLVAGLDEVDRAELGGVMVTPVDAPLVSAATVTTLLAVFDTTFAPVVRPRLRGRHGHPVIFSRALFDELRRADRTVGAKAILRAHAAAVINVDVDDAGVVDDVDTPESYRVVLDRPPQS
jgi:molybdenum cofactor cytidylyltransferase